MELISTFLLGWSVNCEVSTFDWSHSADTFEAASGAFSLTAAVTLSAGSGAMTILVRSATIAVQRLHPRVQHNTNCTVLQIAECRLQIGLPLCPRAPVVLPGKRLIRINHRLLQKRRYLIRYPH